MNRATFPGAELDIGVQLSARVGSLADEVARLRQDIADRETTEVELNGAWDRTTTVVVGGLTCAYFAIQQQCPPGYTWDVTRLGVGADVSPVVASQSGTLYVFASGADHDFSYASWVDSTIVAFPQSAFYSPGEFPVYSGERIYFLVVGYAVGTPLSASGTAVQRKGLTRRAVATVG